MSDQYNVQFLNPVLSAVINVLSTMANIEAKPGKPYLNKERKTTGDITGSIQIEGYTQGVMTLSLSKEAILSIASGMLFEEFTELNEEIADAVGELTNMIAGQARSSLSEQGLNFQAGTPKVIHGKGEKMDHIPAQPILAVPFTCPKGSLVVEISLASN